MTKKIKILSILALLILLLANLAFAQTDASSGVSYDVDIKISPAIESTTGISSDVKITRPNSDNLIDSSSGVIIAPKVVMSADTYGSNAQVLLHSSFNDSENLLGGSDFSSFSNLGITQAGQTLSLCVFAEEQLCSESGDGACCAVEGSGLACNAGHCCPQGFDWNGTTCVDNSCQAVAGQPSDDSSDGYCCLGDSTLIATNGHCCAPGEVWDLDNEACIQTCASRAGQLCSDSTDGNCCFGKGNLYCSNEQFDGGHCCEYGTYWNGAACVQGTQDICDPADFLENGAHFVVRNADNIPVALIDENGMMKVTGSVENSQGTLIQSFDDYVSFIFNNIWQGIKDFFKPSTSGNVVYSGVNIGGFAVANSNPGNSQSNTNTNNINGSAFILKTQDGVSAYVNDLGNLFLSAGLYMNQDPSQMSATSKKEFIIQNSDGENVAIFDEDGNLRLKGCIPDPDANICGNNFIEYGEICDGYRMDDTTCSTFDEFNMGTVSCGSDCLSYDTSSCYNCGDGEISDNEDCDPSIPITTSCNDILNIYYDDLALTCDSTCHFDTSACSRCGDNKANTGFGEACDGSDLAGQTCESYDRNFYGGTLQCNTDCGGFDTSRCEYCGNDILESAHEICDDGAQNGQYGKCGSDCQSLGPHCGDGVLDKDFEQCDDGNFVSGDGCNSECVIEFCGDGIVNNADPVLGESEKCDDGNSINTDSCVNCNTASCGDGYLYTGFEECDEGSQNSNTASDACRKTCKLPICGDGVVDLKAGETCDDKNDYNSDGCHDCKVLPVKCDDGDMFDPYVPDAVSTDDGIFKDVCAGKPTYDIVYDRGNLRIIDLEYFDAKAGKDALLIDTSNPEPILTFVSNFESVDWKTFSFDEHVSWTWDLHKGPNGELPTFASIGDVTGDGLTDLLVGDPFSKTFKDRGVVYLIEGRSDIALFAKEPSISKTAVGSWVGEIPGDYLGSTVSAVGDVNADGFLDFAFSSKSKEVGRATHAGKVYVVLGQKGYPQDQVVSDSIVNIAGDYSDAFFGTNVEFVGDANADGFSDFIVSSINYDLGKGALTSRTTLVLGSANLGSTSASEHTNFIAPAQELPNGVEVSIKGIGDFNGDGLKDFAVGTPTYSGVKLNAGLVSIIFGDQSIGDKSVYDLSDMKKFQSFAGSAQEQRYGTFIHILNDQNGDGVNEILVSLGQGFGQNMIFGSSKNTFVEKNVPEVFNSMDDSVLPLDELYLTTAENGLVVLNGGNSAVKEYYCDYYSNGFYSSTIVNCPFTCENGACLRE
jgi:cysteine-rich repeat protein